MDINELKEAHSRLEGDLAIEVGKLVGEFRKKTGVSIESVSVDMARVTAHGDPQEEYVISNVSCKLAF